ncbi:hypothetical protein [Verrucomicrobium sp. GAS474]|uniref:hypothetical protein n=1 Tax=Verrucomicrobium sp. GAS474 TaxID=1882831 RepID=UPI0012FFA421|nr:hypothetical protein [Verrucomicrobium sp. GAS474]
MYREVTYDWGDRKDAEIIKIVSIEKINDERWECRWCLPHICPEGSSTGIDPFQALLSALSSMRNLIADSGFPNLTVYQFEPGDNANITLEYGSDGVGPAQ